MSPQSKYPAPEGFRKKIKQLMEEKDIGVRGLAKEAHISAGFLSFILNGTRNPSEDNIKNIAKALNFDPSELLIIAGFIPNPTENKTIFFRKAEKLSQEQLQELSSYMDKMMKESDGD